MTNTSRVDKELFESDHYLGKPADDSDRIISRRIEILEQYPEFFGKEWKLIEVGCGAGATINRICSRFDQALGVDIYDYSQAFRESQQHYNATNSSFRHLNLEEEIPQEKFDRLISFEVIEHLRSEDALSRYNEVLTTGGLAAISVPNKWWIFETHGARLPLLPWNRVPFFSWLPTRIHERYANARIYTRSRIESLLVRHGFEILSTQYITAPMDVLKEGKLKRWLIRNIFRENTTGIPFLSTSIFVLARKIN